MLSQITTYYYPFNDPNERISSLGAHAPRYTSDAVKRIVGVLGGEINRKATGLSGRVMEQKRPLRRSLHTEWAGRKATAIASYLTQVPENLQLDFRIDDPRFLAASFTAKRAENKFSRTLEWMLLSGVEVIITLEDWMEKQMLAFSTDFQLVSSYHLPGKLAENTKIWTIRNTLNTTHEQLSHSIAQQLEYSQELH